MEFNYANRSRPGRDRNGEVLLLSRLAEAEALLLEERASKQALVDELSRARSAAVEQQDRARVAESVHQDEDFSSDGQAQDNGSRRSAMHVGGFSSAGAGAGAGVCGATPTGRAPTTQERAAEDDRPPWKNVLYERQPYADNFVPDSFLEKLVTNCEYEAFSRCVRVTGPQVKRATYRERRMVLVISCW